MLYFYYFIAAIMPLFSMLLRHLLLPMLFSYAAVTILPCFILICDMPRRCHAIFAADSDATLR